MDIKTERREALADELEHQGDEDAAQRIRECCVFGSGWRCDPITCGQTRVAVPLYCRRRTCPVCAPLDAARVRRELERKIRYVQATQQRPKHAWMMVTPTLKTVPAVLRRPDRDAKGRPCSRFVREFTNRATRLLREANPGEPQGASDGTRRRRRRLGAGGALAVEVGSNLNLHAHAIVYGRFMPKSVQERWRKLSRYRACAQCGSHRWGKRDAPCPDAACPLHGKPMDLVESFIVHVRAVRGGVERLVRYVTKYVAKPADSAALEDVARVEWLLRGVRRIRTWGSLQGIPEPELEAAGCGREKPEPMICGHCGNELAPEDTMRCPSRKERRRQSQQLTLEGLVRSGYVVGDYRRRRRSPDG